MTGEQSDFLSSKSGGEKWCGYLCLTEVKSFSPRPNASPLTVRQPSAPASTHLVRSHVCTGCCSGAGAQLLSVRLTQDSFNSAYELE